MIDASGGTRRRIAAVTGSRAEFGLLEPVLRAVDARPELVLDLLVTGAHLLPPQRTVDEVTARHRIAATVPMQTPSAAGRFADAAAVGRGVTGFADCFRMLRPDVVLVLGDRIEAFAAAAAASVAGIRVAHMHGGDRAEGIADDALRHAITKLAHLHLAATEASAERIRRLGEDPARVHVVGSPALDDLDAMPALDDAAHTALGAPSIVVLLHPDGDPEPVQRRRAERLLEACAAAGPTLVLDPNHDAGRDALLEVFERHRGVTRAGHLPRPAFVGLLRRAALLAGNSSAGLIECAALGVPAVNVGPRQSGRERAANVIAADDDDLAGAVAAALARGHRPVEHPFGDARAGSRTAAVLATFDPEACGVRKVNGF